MTLFLQLLLAHLIGDFILQPGSWVREREAKGLRSPRFYLHVLVHGALPMLLVGRLGFWPLAALIALSHGLIDLAKARCQRPDTRRRWFLIDQVLHLCVIGAVWTWVQRPHILPAALLSGEAWMYLTALVLISWPTSVAIRIFISRWTPHTEELIDGSLQQAGQYIGILERLFVFGFVVSGHLEAVGFLLAAKSIFRFGDLRESKDRKLTEYVLIGTLLSFGTALLAGALVKGYAA